MPDKKNPLSSPPDSAEPRPAYEWSPGKLLAYQRPDSAHSTHHPKIWLAWTGFGLSLISLTIIAIDTTWGWPIQIEKIAEISGFLAWPISILLSLLAARRRIGGWINKCAIAFWITTLTFGFGYSVKEDGLRSVVPILGIIALIGVPFALAIVYVVDVWWP